MPRSRSSLLTKFFIRGIAALLPTMLTVFIVYRIAVFVHANLGTPLNNLITRLMPFLAQHGYSRLLGDAVGVLLVLIICMFVGFVLTSFIGRRIFASIERTLIRLPVLRAVYPPIKQVTDFFLSEDARAFSRVVAVEYPRKGIYSIGFVTGTTIEKITDARGQKLVSVFIPSSPTPMTGYVILFPDSDLLSLDLTVEEALRFTVSAGVLSPGTTDDIVSPEESVQIRPPDTPPLVEEGDSQ